MTLFQKIALIVGTSLLAYAYFLPAPHSWAFGFASFALIVFALSQRFAREFLQIRRRIKLQQAKQAAQAHLQPRTTQQHRQEQYFLEAALAGDLSITPGMLPKSKAKSIELLRCLVAENYLKLSSQRMILGEGSIDWQVEMLRLIETALQEEGIEQLALTRPQSYQAMNSYLNHLESEDDPLLQPVTASRRAA